MIRDTHAQQETNKEDKSKHDRYLWSHFTHSTILCQKLAYRPNYLAFGTHAFLLLSDFMCGAGSLCAILKVALHCMHTAFRESKFQIQEYSGFIHNIHFPQQSNFELVSTKWCNIHVSIDNLLFAPGVSNLNNFMPILARISPVVTNRKIAWIQRKLAILKIWEN